MATNFGHWWFDLVADGTRGRVHVQHFHGDLETWDKWGTIRKANPLINIDPHTRKVVLEERDNARTDSRLKARFLSYRLNLPTRDESDVLLTLDDWKRVAKREPGNADGQPLVGVDLGGGRAFSAAVAIYPSGLIDAVAIAPGIPELSDQEVRDRVPRGTYERLYDSGTLLISEGLRVPPPRQLWEAISERWGRPKLITCDRFRLAELQDVVRGKCRIDDRVVRWSEAAFDIRALRKGAKDGPFSATLGSRELIQASIGVAHVKNDDQGNVRMVKNASNAARDDVAAALVLAAGAYERRPKRTGIYHGLA